MWNDTRLDIDRDVLDRISNEDRSFALDERLEDLMWMPKPKVINIRGEQVGSVSLEKSKDPIRTSPQKALSHHTCTMFMLTNDENRRLFNKHGHSVTFNCPMDFTAFPFDLHSCIFEVYTLQSCLGSLATTITMFT